MKTIEYAVQYHVEGRGLHTDRIEVRARDLNSGIKKALDRAVRDVADPHHSHWHLVSVVFTKET